MPELRRRCRVCWKAVRLVATLLLSILDFFFVVWLPGRGGSRTVRAAWLQRQARRLASVLAIRPTYHGEPPVNGVLACNHLGYADILVLGARHPLAFIAKADVSGWPIFGSLARFGGSLFIRRELRSDVVRIGAEMPDVIDAGVVLAFFPEGTSTGGDRILPFHASLFAPFVEHGWNVTPAFLRYELPDGDGIVADDVAYWRDMVFGPHLLSLLGKRRIDAVVTYGSPMPAGTDRKALSAAVRDEVCRLGAVPAGTAAKTTTVVA